MGDGCNIVSGAGSIGNLVVNRDYRSGAFLPWDTSGDGFAPIAHA